ncbi:MAG TPA: SIMPL domain-containing protein [Chthonomonadales bacterium]|nr:SIMPL domain-containing protein [Chthonomonadales bacterium]
MKQAVIALLLLTVPASMCAAQVAGNVAYGQASGRAQAEQNERAKRVIGKEDVPPTSTSLFIDAHVLMNVRASEYVAVFGVQVEAATPAECGAKMDAAVGRFRRDLAQAGIPPAAVYVDYIAQNRIYDYKVTDNVAKEELSGFELKKNISVRYTNSALLDNLVLLAARSQIYDLIKVDYIVPDTQSVRTRLFAEAVRVILRKSADYRLLGTAVKGPPQVYADRSSTYFPTRMYDSYTAYESGDVNAGYYAQKFVVQNARKSSTFYFNPLDASGFDSVINPVVMEPVVQFTLYLKMRYGIAQYVAAGKPRRSGLPQKRR